MNTYINKKTGAVVTVNSEISGDWELVTPNPVDEVSSAQLDEPPADDKTSAEEKPKRTGKKKD